LKTLIVVNFQVGKMNDNYYVQNEIQWVANLYWKTYINENEKVPRSNYFKVVHKLCQFLDS